MHLVSCHTCIFCKGLFCLEERGWPHDCLLVSSAQFLFEAGQLTFLDYLFLKQLQMNHVLAANRCLYVSQSALRRTAPTFHPRESDPRDRPIQWSRFCGSFHVPKCPAVVSPSPWQVDPALR